MKTVQISAVKRIVTDAVDLIVLALANGKPDIVRTPEQFLNDLKGSFLIDDNINNMRHPQVRKALRNLKGGTLEGNLKYVKAGDEWKVTENSQVVTNKNAKGFGEYAVGDMKAYEKDATIVEEGFLTLDFKEDAYQREENAQAYAKERVSSVTAFDIPADTSGEGNPEPLIEHVIDESGNAEPEPETPPVKGQVDPEVATEATGG